MMLRTLANIAILFACATSAQAAPPIELELATDRGVQITAPQEWLQLLAGIGIENVRIRSMRPGDQPQVVSRGTAERPGFRVVGILTARNELRLESGTFARSDRAGIKDYFDRLTADGAESLTAVRGMFGLTETEIKAVFADLAQPIDFETKDQPLRAVLDRSQAKFKSKLVADPASERLVKDAEPIADELKGVSAGTALAIALRSGGLELRPEKQRGQPVVYRVAPAMATSSVASTIGRAGDHEIARWPIGWEPDQTPGRTAPALFELLNAEIDGYSLAEALAAIGPRVKVPMYFDHAALLGHKIDPAEFQVHLPRMRTSYKRVIDRILSQARLHSQVRVDEAGKPFLWMTR